VENDNVEITADLVSAYVSNNSVAATDLPALIAQIHTTLNRLSSGEAEVPAAPKQEPAVPIKKSVTPDFIICLEDGKKFKSMRRHLMGSFKMTPDDYRRKWGLPDDYPMVAPNYATARSALAKKIGLGVGGLGGRAPRKASAA
jgi:predicted transcriptional regulator